MTNLQLPVSPYRKGAETGLFFGIYLSCMFLSWVFAAQFPLLIFVTVLAAAGVPFYTYRTLHATLVAEHGTTPVVSLWMQGITMMACGALICALLILIWFKWIDPGFIVRQMQLVIDTYSNTSDPSLSESARIATVLLEKNAIPPLHTWVLFFWLFTVFTGSLLSCLMAILARFAVTRRNSRKT